MCAQTPSAAKTSLRERDVERTWRESKTGNKEKQSEKLDLKQEIRKIAKGSVETERGQDSERERVCRRVGGVMFVGRHFIFLLCDVIQLQRQR